MAGLAVQNFARAAVGIAVAGRGDPRHRAHARARDARQLLVGPRRATALRAAADRVRRRRWCSSRRAWSSRSPASRTAAIARRPGRLAGGDQGARARTAAASSTSTRAMPFENPTAFTNFVEMLLILLHPGGADRDVRADGRQPPAGLGDLRARCSSCSSSRWRSSTPPSAHGTPAQHPAGRSPAATWRARRSRFGIAELEPVRARSRPSPRAAR